MDIVAAVKAYEDNDEEDNESSSRGTRRSHAFIHSFIHASLISPFHFGVSELSFRLRVCLRPIHPYSHASLR